MDPNNLFPLEELSGHNLLDHGIQDGQALSEQVVDWTEPNTLSTSSGHNSSNSSSKMEPGSALNTTADGTRIITLFKLLQIQETLFSKCHLRKSGSECDFLYARADDILKQPHGCHGYHEVLSFVRQGFLCVKAEIPLDQHPGISQHQVKDYFHQLRQEVAGQWNGWYKSRIPNLSQLPRPKLEWKGSLKMEADVALSNSATRFEDRLAQLPGIIQLVEGPEEGIAREVLEQQHQERYDADFCGICMFCDKEFTGNRSVLLNHMANEHAFNVGLPDNIVNCKEFLDLLQKKLDSLQCLYCEKIFRDKNTLKDHMRKKQHRRINAKNREYDRFYIINYLEFGKSWEEVQSEDDRELLHSQEEDWSDWEEHPVCAVCLFCEKQAETTKKLYIHMEEAHGFGLLKIKSEYGLNFYQQVKLVNFIRRKVHQCLCYNCLEKFQSKKELVRHMEETKHITLLPARSMWDQPQYYFPTYENDTLLCTLSDSEDELTAGKQNEDVPVISEDVSNIEALKQGSVLNQLLREEINDEEP
ncbi:hypothetical protein EYD10_07276 [Varanus komodoensis]|nr:hypothetical protein EYD10_07276 [Varanus komodoensis]